MNHLSAKIKQYLNVRFGLIFLILLASFGCNEKGNAPDKATAPELWYISHKTIAGIISDSLLIITLGYKDTDGDIGLNLDDTLPPYQPGGLFQFNLNVDFLKLENGNEDTIFVFGTNRPQIFHQRIPDLRPTGRIKLIEGTLEIAFGVGPLTLYPDVVKGYFKLTDRKLQSSPIISTGPIYLDQ